MIIDVMQVVGMLDGCYMLCGEEVQMYGGVVCIVFGGLVGSMLFVDVVVCNMVELMGVMFVEVIYMVLLYLV